MSTGRSKSLFSCNNMTSSAKNKTLIPMLLFNLMSSPISLLRFNNNNSNSISNNSKTHCLYNEKRCDVRNSLTCKRKEEKGINITQNTSV